ncbi:hypothetical protein Q9290_16345 [Oceanimonas sp. CHS3-5]|uniref:hypothetical protein n=1 Tax=Oceanimonas sp. CHS3-5 TaxID=3068186 RepID=UPI00273F39C7|nr:hypothetical protein [Oceanimonas sp. CHS3-5]MDP5293841.1 hypothetical protein [Oceanimonas sp. CHS3-5]
MKLISLHLPKTAGSSFRTTLEEVFGERLLCDYGDRSISKPRLQRHKEVLASALDVAEQGLSNYDCVHGHFLPLKYLSLADSEPCTFITWMRHPVERLISHYHFWQQTYDPELAAPHHKKVIEEKWSLEQFCLSKQFRNIYSQYLWGFPLENFAFVGITEHYNDDLSYLSEYFLKQRLNKHRMNVTAGSSARQGLPPVIQLAVERFHAADMQLYERALKMRKSRNMTS